MGKKYTYVHAYTTLDDVYQPEYLLYMYINIT